MRVLHFSYQIPRHFFHSRLKQTMGLEAPKMGTRPRKSGKGEKAGRQGELFPHGYHQERLS